MQYYYGNAEVALRHAVHATQAMVAWDADRSWANLAHAAEHIQNAFAVCTRIRGVVSEWSDEGYVSIAERLGIAVNNVDFPAPVRPMVRKW